MVRNVHVRFHRRQGRRHDPTEIPSPLHPEYRSTTIYQTYHTLPGHTGTNSSSLTFYSLQVHQYDLPTTKVAEVLHNLCLRGLDVVLAGSDPHVT